MNFVKSCASFIHSHHQIRKVEVFDFFQMSLFFNLKHILYIILLFYL